MDLEWVIMVIRVVLSEALGLTKVFCSFSMVFLSTKWWPFTFISWTMVFVPWFSMIMVSSLLVLVAMIKVIRFNSILIFVSSFWFQQFWDFYANFASKFTGKFWHPGIWQVFLLRFCRGDTNFDYANLRQICRAMVWRKFCLKLNSKQFHLKFFHNDLDL